MGFNTFGTLNTFEGNAIAPTPTLSKTLPLNNTLMFQTSGLTTGAHPYSCTITDLPSGDRLMYKIDDGTAQVLDATPANGVNTGGVPVPNGTHTVKIYLESDESISVTATGLSTRFDLFCGGQSNMHGAGLNNQTLTLNEGDPTPVYYKLWGGGADTAANRIATLRDPSAIEGTGGSIVPKLGSLYANNGVSFGVINAAVNGTSMSRWVKSADDLYPESERLSAINGGGYSAALMIIGETDVGSDIAVQKSRMVSFVDDMYADYGCDTYIAYTPKSDLGGNYAIQNAMYDEIIAENEHAKFGGNLSVIDVTDGDGDDTHLLTDEELTQGAEIVFTAMTGISVLAPPAITALTPLTDIAANTPVQVTATVTEGDGTIVSHAWTQTSGAETVTLTGATTATVGFTTPATAQTTVLTLLVTDSNGETDSETWSVTNLVADTTKPVINLTPNQTSFTITVGDSFTAPTAIATDNVDSDVSVTPVDVDTFNNAVAGTYTYTYDHTDSSGNVADTVTVTVTVQSVSALMNAIAQAEFEIEFDGPGRLHVYRGRSNLFDFKMKQINELDESIDVDASGYFDFSNNEVTKIEFIANGSVIDSTSSAVTFSGNTVLAELGALTVTYGNQDLRMVLYIGADTKGIVVAGPGLHTSLPATIH